MLWLLIWRRALPTPSATSPALHGSSLQPLLVSVWSSTQRSSCSDPSYLIRRIGVHQRTKQAEALPERAAPPLFLWFQTQKTAARSDGTRRRLVFYNTIDPGIVPFFSKRYLQKMVLLYWAKARCAVLSPVRRSHGSLPPQRL